MAGCVLIRYIVNYESFYKKTVAIVVEQFLHVLYFGPPGSDEKQKWYNHMKIQDKNESYTNGPYI